MYSNDVTSADNIYPVFPLKNTVVFPSMVLPITAGRPSSLAAIEAAMSTEDKLIAVFTQIDAAIKDPEPKDLYPIGTLCVIRRMQRSEGAIQLMLQGSRRIETKKVIQTTPYPKFEISFLPEPVDTSPEVEALHRTMLDLATRMLSLAPMQMQIDLKEMVSELDHPIEQAYVLASLTSIEVDKQFKLLAASSQQQVLQLLIDYLTHEVQVLEVQSQISQAVESKMSKEQREIMLRKQMHEIQSQLGEKTPEQADMAELKQRLDEAKIPDLVRKELNKELLRLERMSISAPDYQTIRSYIDLALDMPWEKVTEDNLDLERARNILDEDHFDLKEVKDRIIEHLAVMKLNPKAKAPILCFVGPPGVGKTSLGQSIARALGRVFERISLGGLHDEAELRGHRRTYVGAMPGRILRAIRRAQVKNPLLMLDEIDKLGHDFRGDPAAALMEILDPSQNFEFHDNYLDFNFDLSKVFFIGTANTLDSIPAPLLDRVEILQLSGYSDNEKREIAQRYILNRRMYEAGINQNQLIITAEILDYIIQNYTREAGVRSLERAIGKITRKVATKIAQGNLSDTTLSLSKDLVKEYLGVPRWSRASRREVLAPGVVAGLAWTETGGEVLYVEAVLLPEGKGLVLTGQLGNVMQESAKAAQSYIWSQADVLGIDKDFIRKSGVHIHVPAGATPKDGPSAGVTMVTALASAYLGKSVDSDIAMTGEITLTGLVLPVGGIKEKILAAHRSGFKRVILPKENMQDLSELSEQVQQEIMFTQIEKIADIFQFVFK